MMDLVAFHDIMKPACTAHSSQVASSSGYGRYSARAVMRSCTASEMEFVPRKTTMMRFGHGGWDRAMYPQESGSSMPVFQVCADS